MTLFRQILNFLRRIEQILLVLLLAILVVFSFVQLLLRLLFSFGFPWADIFFRHIVLWIGFIGGAVALGEQKHFAMDFFKKKFSSRTLFFMNVLSDLFAIGTLYFLFNAGITFWQEEFIYKSVLFTVGSWEVPTYAFNVILPLGFLLLLVQSSFKFMDDLVLFLNKNS